MSDECNCGNPYCDCEYTIEFEMDPSWEESIQDPDPEDE